MMEIRRINTNVQFKTGVLYRNGDYIDNKT